jgi:hypothetical protein
LEHPILLGLAGIVGFFCSVALEGAKRTWMRVLCVVGSLSSVSSGPLLGFFVGLGMLAYLHFYRSWEKKWTFAGYVFLFSVAVLYATVDNPIGIILSKLTLNPESGWYRLWVFNFILDQIPTYPWWGRGFEFFLLKDNNIYGGFNMYASLDCLWLVMAIAHGIPSVIFLALSIIGSTSEPVDLASIKWLTDDEKQIGRYLNIILIVYMFEGCTVHYWGTMWIFLGFFIGLRAVMSDIAKRRRLEYGASQTA